MTDCGFELEMATTRDDQSARVTKKKLKDVQYVYSAQTQKKRDQRMTSRIIGVLKNYALNCNEAVN